MAEAVGIDPGTTNSVAAVAEGGQPAAAAPDAEGARTTPPSVVASAERGERPAGLLARP